MSGIARAVRAAVSAAAAAVPKRRNRRKRAGPVSQRGPNPVKSGRRRNRRRSKPGKSSSSNMAQHELNCYANSIANPFENPPCRIGFGTMAPTELVTAYYRATVLASHTDGSIAFAAFPECPALFNFTNTNASTAAWSNAAAANQPSILTLINSARVISLGIRVIPQVPATAAPGTVYAGAIPALTYNNLLVTTPNVLSGLPLLKAGLGASGASAVGHPISPASYDFSTSPLYDFSPTVIPDFTVPIIVLTGLPIDTPVFVEVVMNLEGIAGPQSASAAMQMTGQSAVSQPSLADHFASLDTVISRVSRLLPATASVDEGGGGTTRHASFLNTRQAYSRGASYRSGNVLQP